jgi:molybdate transport system permease protein
MAPLFAALTPAEAVALWLSVKVALAATLLSLPLGILLAYALARGRFIGKSVLDALIHLPLVVPPVVTGFALLLLFGARGPIGEWLQHAFGLTLVFRWTGAALASAVMGLPLLVRPIRLSLEAVDRRLERAATTLGAPPLWRLATVTLPLAFPGILAGVVLSFARSFGEFGATITFVGSIEGETRTLPLQIYNLLQVPGGEAGALRLSLVSIAIAFAALLASEWLARRAARGREGL